MIQRVESADGTPIAYRTAGEGDAVVFVHGACTAGADWTLALPYLRERFTVVTMDRRGRGESGDGPDYSMEREADDILAVLEAVDSELLVAHSYGALCSILAAQRTGRLRRLVLYEAPIGVRGERVPGLDELVARGERDAAVEAFLRNVGTTDEQMAAIRASRAWPILVDAVPRLPRELRAIAGWRNPRGPVEVPTLFLTGAETTNPVYLDGLEELRGAFPGSQYERIPGQLHVAHVFAAEEFAGLVADFLERG